MKWRSRQLRRRDLEARGWHKVITWIPTKCRKCMVVIWFDEFWRQYKVIDCRGEGEYMAVCMRCPPCYVTEVLEGAGK